MYPIFALYEPKEFKCLNDARFDLQNFRMRFFSISDWPRMFEYLCHWLTNQRDSLKTLLSQNQTENESETSFQFNGKEGICSETCEKFLTRSRRNAAPAAVKKDRFHTYFLSLEESEVDDQSVVTISLPIISFGSDHVMKSCVGGRWIMLFQEYWIFYWKIWLSSMFRFWKLFLVTKYESEIVTKRWLIGMVWQFQLSRWFNQCDTCNRTQFNLSRSRLVFKLHLASDWLRSNRIRIDLKTLQSQKRINFCCWKYWTCDWFIHWWIHYRNCSDWLIHPIGLWISSISLVENDGNFRTFSKIFWDVKMSCSSSLRFPSSHWASNQFRQIFGHLPFSGPLRKFAHKLNIWHIQGQSHVLDHKLKSEVKMDGPIK